MKTAREQVFSTPELFEAILSHLPPHDLLLAQRISHSFQTAIQSSPRIQQALFFRPTPLKDPNAWSLNPLLRKHFIPWFVLVGDGWSRWTLPEWKTLELLDWANDETKRVAFLRAEASWRRMLLVQPPPEDLRVVQICHGQIGDSVEEAILSFADSKSGGVTMDKVYDLTESFVGSELVSQFGLSIRDSNIGPQITLNLIFTMQCCLGAYPDKNVDLTSRGSECFSVRCLDLKERDDSRGRVSMDLNTDLTTKRGGVSQAEFEKWQRERVPISSLLSDVR